jgi:5-aminopentanamidase
MQVAGVQMDISLGQVSLNLRRILDRFDEACRHGARLVVFPECATSGYCFDSAEEARPHALTCPGSEWEPLLQACRKNDAFLVTGTLETRGSQLFNSAVLLGPHGHIATYRKVHLPFLGVDRFTDYGDEPFAVHAAGDVQLGMNICYDGGFCEPARVLALLGADVIVLPTNWPPSAEPAADYAINTRAMENTVNYVAVNRVGIERGVQFIGRSKICNPLGMALASAPHTDETILYATLDIPRARKKHLIRTAGQNEVDRFADRRPEFYEPIVQPHQRLTPRQRAAADTTPDRPDQQR